MKQLANENINFCIIRVDNRCDQMIEVMKKNFNTPQREMIVQDLEKALQTKTSVEVTKDFVAATSFILSKAVAGKGKGKKAAAIRSDPLWDTSKFEVGQWCSSLTYYNVKAIDGKSITVTNSFGDEHQISKDILEKMYSANHFNRERNMNMTELAELLETAGDTCFTVSFRKQVNHDRVEEKLLSTSAS